MKIKGALSILLLAGAVLSVLAAIAVSKYGTSTPIRREEQTLLGQAGKPTTLTLGEGDTEKVWESPAFKAKYRFNAIAPQWEEELGSAQTKNRQVYLRTSQDGKTWSEWLDIGEVGPLRDDDPQPRTMLPEFPLLAEGKFFQYRVVLKRDKLADPAPEISGLKVTYIDSHTPPLTALLNKLRPEVTTRARQEPVVISRAQWGSPDPYGQRFRGTSRWWAPTYKPVKQIFIHHTVFNKNDSAAAVRAIWEYHTYTRGWGDIGYNYLVDRNGVIYEGRAGGDNVVAGHTYTYNRRSLGVAVLGCFETASSACAGAPRPSSAMISSLTTLLAWKSTSYEINPNTTQTFCGLRACKTLWTIAGHRNANPTACPGNLIYTQLGNIRRQTRDKKNTWQYSAKQLDFGAASFSDYSLDKPVTIRFKNTGTAAWSNTTNRMLLKLANPSTRISIFQGTGWLDAQTPAVLNEASVAPGEIGSFTFNLQSPLNSVGYYFESFSLAVEGGLVLSPVFSVVVLPPSYRWKFLEVSYSKGSNSMSSGEKQTIILSAKNVGTATWNRDDPWPVRLGTWRSGRRSSFYDSSWLGPTRLGLLDQTSVAPGEIGTFTFTITAPSEKGRHNERVNLVAAGLTWLNDANAKFTIDVF
jgi:hypothetical protein